MLTYEQWKQHQQELEDRAKIVFDKLQPILKSYLYEVTNKENWKGYKYNLSYIDNDQTCFSLFIHGDDCTYYFDTELLFLDDEQLQFHIEDELAKSAWIEEQEKLEAERIRVEQYLDKKRHEAYERLRTNG